MTTEDKLLTSRELADHVHAHIDTIHSWAREPGCPAINLSKAGSRPTFRWPLAETMAWRAVQTAAAAEQPRTALKPAPTAAENEMSEMADKFAGVYGRQKQKNDRQLRSHGTRRRAG